MKTKIVSTILQKIQKTRGIKPKSRAVSDDVHKMLLKYTPPRVKTYENTDMLIGTTYLEISDTINSDNFTLELDFTTNVSVELFRTIDLSKVNTNETGWVDQGVVIFGVQQLSGPFHDIIYQDFKMRARTLLKITSTVDHESYKIDIIYY